MAAISNPNGIPYIGAWVELNLYREGELIGQYGSYKREMRKKKINEWNKRIKPLTNKNQYFIIIKIDH